ncbi:hypothetical protein ACGF5C_02855 [Micromonospora sp. NPDC047620]|uniref:hypothetical protein n=1 Tax=Micromonospora sp. NPDC047620 TaxID=3364251 RepID=UPI00371D3D20
METTTVTDYLAGLDAPLREITDPSGRLVPGARQMAAVKLRTLADVDPALFTDWLRQAHDLEAK